MTYRNRPETVTSTSCRRSRCSMTKTTSYRVMLTILELKIRVNKLKQTKKTQKHKTSADVHMMKKEWLSYYRALFFGQ